MAPLDELPPDPEEPLLVPPDPEEPLVEELPPDPEELEMPDVPSAPASVACGAPPEEDEPQAVPRQAQINPHHSV